MRCDITDTAALRATLAEAAEKHGPITVLVNNAANDKRHSAEEVTEDSGLDAGDKPKCYFFACPTVMRGCVRRVVGRSSTSPRISYMMGNAGYPAYTTANADNGG